MLQMVRTLAQFTIALEDMRELGDAADTTLSPPSSVGGAAEETPEKNGSSPTKNGMAEVMRRKGGGVAGKGKMVGRARLGGLQPQKGHGVGMGWDWPRAFSQPSVCLRHEAPLHVRLFVKHRLCVWK